MTRQIKKAVTKKVKKKQPKKQLFDSTQKSKCTKKQIWHVFSKKINTTHSSTQGLALISRYNSHGET